MEPKTKRDCYSEITNAIIADLEKGVRPWVKPWEGSGAIPCRPLRITSEPYRGINVLLLWSATHQQGFQSAYWLTFQQALHQGGHIRKGEKSTTVVFSGTLTKTPGVLRSLQSQKVSRFRQFSTLFRHSLRDLTRMGKQIRALQ